MALAIFDLDNTLIGGDSDQSWIEFLCEQGFVDVDFYLAENERFYQEYLRGVLDVHEWVAFQTKILVENPPEQAFAWREQYLQEKVAPLMLPKATELIESHRKQGDTLLVITATNNFLAEKIVENLGIENMIATMLERKDGKFTGKIDGIPSYKEGKITRLEMWLEENPISLEDSYFYSDSHNDLPLLRHVSYPVAVDGDETLNQVAKESGWKMMSLRD